MCDSVDLYRAGEVFAGKFAGPGNHPPRRLSIAIADNGPGIPPAIRDRIFYPLVSGREGGSGLGLTIAQTFVAQHSGTIECDSEPGRTVFRILLPVDLPRAAAPAADAP